MAYITDPAEVAGALGHPVEGPVYKTIRTDADGCEVAVPVFKAQKKGKRSGLGKGLLAAMAVALVMALLWALVLMASLVAQASGLGYESAEQTEDPEVVALTEAVAEAYPVCPELLQAVIFFESRNQRIIISHWGDVGYMQINPRWQQDRMDRLGVRDLEDGYSNIMVGADLLCELFAEYEDPALVLMAYNHGIDRALELYSAGRVSGYALGILELSERLERLHGK